ncbi:ATP synthase subunit B family protein [Anaeromicropila populeti]|uniref:Uncharacterized protein n=1 Tax=Anaeromicropila populeti TaxID=37658 RepID=A0A1I6LS98_9FIRM|nr:hypothetical protein [Anaeromicropila populeti]SFS06365.1 hypothetical protein SAMN05661086_03535 [Anaeromicropila populeti]
MILTMFEKNILVYIMLALCGLGILIKFVVSCVYGRLVRASDQMGASANKLIKTLRLKFETSYSMKLGVNNVDIFVDKYVYKHKFCGILLYTWENFSGQLLLLCMLTGTAGALLGLTYDCGKEKILFTFFIGVLTSAMLIVFEQLMNIQTKKSVLRTNIRDYLENYLKVKLEKGEVNLQGSQAEMLAEQINAENKKRAESKALDEKTKDSGKNTLQQKEVTKLYEINKREEKIIQDILREYII